MNVDVSAPHVALGALHLQVQLATGHGPAPERTAAKGGNDEKQRLREATRDALRRAAEADRRTMSSLAVLVIEGWLAAHGFLAVPKRQRKTKQAR